MDEIGFDPSGKWSKVICTYKWYRTENLWKTKTGGKSPFWVTMLYSIRADGQAFIPPTLVHKASKINEGHTLYLPEN